MYNTITKWGWSVDAGAAAAIAGAGGLVAWDMHEASRSTWEGGDGVAVGDEGDRVSTSSRSSSRAHLPLPAPWLDNKEGECATSTNWSGNIVDGCTGGVELVSDEGRAAKGKTCSSKTTSPEIYTRLDGTWRHLFPLWIELYPRKTHFFDRNSSLRLLYGRRCGQHTQPNTLRNV